MWLIVNQLPPEAFLEAEVGLGIGRPRELMLLPTVLANVVQGVQDVHAADAATKQKEKKC